jgi:hypothetical protein
MPCTVWLIIGKCNPGEKGIITILSQRERSVPLSKLDQRTFFLYFY